MPAYAGHEPGPGEGLPYVAPGSGWSDTRAVEDPTQDIFDGLREWVDRMQTPGGAEGLTAESNTITGVVRPPTSAEVLAAWWREKAESEIDMVVAKSVEYGGKGAAIDLIDIGRDIAAVMGREVTDAEATELGIYYYVRGKFARWRAAMLEGRPVSDDTLLDIGIYTRMAQRNRVAGGWPFGPEEEQ